MRPRLIPALGDRVYTMPRDGHYAAETQSPEMAIILAIVHLTPLKKQVGIVQLTIDVLRLQARYRR